MMALDSGTFPDAWRVLLAAIREAPRVDQQRWQGVDVSKDRSAACYEVRNATFEVDLGSREDLDHWRTQIEPNLPWADDHFMERVGGEPLNPGVEWANWPWGRSAAKFRDGDEKFNHTYMERLWPRYARMTDRGELSDDVLPSLGDGRTGIGWRYGDLDDLVDLLVRDPWTRQAWIPLFHPEDTGWGDGGRKPCTLGYQLLRRGDRLSMFYPLRSCDLVRHFRDDCYLAVRLLLWVLDRCRERDSESWSSVVPGDYAMWMTSLHVFENDMIQIKKGAFR